MTIRGVNRYNFKRTIGRWLYLQLGVIGRPIIALGISTLLGRNLGKTNILVKQTYKEYNL